MARHGYLLVALFVLLTISVQSKDKKKILPAYVLHAQTVVVVIDPDAGTSLANPNENQVAQEDVEKALLNWRRFSPVMDAQTADLVVSVRRGHGKMVSPTVGGIPNDRPVLVQPDGSDIRIGAQRGRNTPVTEPSVTPPPAGARPGTEIGPSEDTLAVYRGQVEYPLDAPPIWRYTAKDALSSPQVPAVLQFRKIIEETEKQLTQKTP
jgi:hypothetical protein